MRSLAPVPTSQHGAVSATAPRDLQQAKFVFIRRDAHRTPLQHPYGPFKVIQRGPKIFQIDRAGKTETISVDRLKPAHTDLEHSDRPVTPDPRPDPYERSSPHPECPRTPQPLGRAHQTSATVHLGSGGGVNRQTDARATQELTYIEPRDRVVIVHE